MWKSLEVWVIRILENFGLSIAWNFCSSWFVEERLLDSTPRHHSSRQRRLSEHAFFLWSRIVRICQISSIYLKNEKGIEGTHFHPIEELNLRNGLSFWKGWKKLCFCIVLNHERQGQQCITREGQYIEWGKNSDVTLSTIYHIFLICVVI